MQNNLIRILADTVPDFKKTLHLIDSAFPEFAFHGAVINKHWRNLYDRFADYQFGLFDTDANEFLVLANSFPLLWDRPPEELPDGGIEWALVTAVEQHERGIRPNSSARSRSSRPPRRGARALAIGRSR